MNTVYLRRVRRLFVEEEGVTIVEMAISVSALLAMVIGCFQLGLGIYTFQLVADAAREGSRFAMVRGSTCSANVTQAYCSPSAGNASGATNADVQGYINTLHYPGNSNLVASTSWLTASGSTPTTWSNCATAPCNIPGNVVKVTVTYAYPLNIPFVPNRTINFSSTSAEVISQ